MTSGNGAASGSVHLRVERTRSGAFIETVHSGTGNVKDTVLLTPGEVDTLIAQLATLSPFSKDYAYPGALHDAMHIPSAIERRAADAARRVRERELLAPPDPMRGVMVEAYGRSHNTEPGIRCWCHETHNPPEGAQDAG